MNKQTLAITAGVAVILAGTVVGGIFFSSADESSDTVHTMADGSTMTQKMIPSSASDVPFDRAFVDGMIPHHESAIEMARAAKGAGLSEPDLIRVADAIIATQQEEIDEMEAWRKEWFGSAMVDPAGAATLGLSDEEMGMQHDASMLEAAEDVDASFASMMIDHHKGAIVMARLAVERGEHEQTRDLAERIISDQEREIGALEPYASADGSMEGMGQ